MLDYRPYRESSTNSLPPAPATLDAGIIHVNLRTFDVSTNERPVPLTRLEFDLLVYLIRNAGRVVCPEELMQHVVRSAYRKESSLIRVHVTHLRKKLGPTAASIVTVRGRGFLFRKSR
jgi:DNA-binding response OmpR family regulator